MTAVDTELIQDTELERVERWREEELRRAGYDPEAATLLAPRHDVDLHLATALLRQGCSTELALEILL